MKLATLRQRSYETVVLALLVGCAVWVGKLVSQHRELAVMVAATGSLAERSSVRDRLVGAVLPLSFLKIDEAESGGDHLVWIVDVERCRTCVEGNVGPWNALAEDMSLQRHVVLYGDQGLPAVAQRALRGTTVMSATRELASALGPILPSTKLLIDGSGTIIMADARDDASVCGWSFEAQVGSLRGVFSTDVIRSQRLSP
ncbi:MAG: hypothetical protein OXI39_00560 [Gemmatimonadota bacterium]|uniref:hypothetical protein n=1 Tax=Candidatus Palauibacter scopulicola TaxID=3056741 RepID=UPI0023A08C5C|nr:hypothetical protein [Candidatus Palauibacter scopulicola]MDE2661483.1 hypothetical protein [Candidatus Palauibacter scopulicola]